MLIHTFFKNLTSFNCKILNVNNTTKNNYPSNKRFFKDKIENIGDYNYDIKITKYNVNIKYYEKNDKIEEKLNSNKHNYEEYNKLFNQLYNDLVIKDLNSDLKNIYNYDTYIKQNTIIKFKNLLYLNEKILYLLFDSNIYKENLSYGLSNDYVLNITKEHINFYKNHCLNSGNIWNNFDQDTIENIKTKYFNNFTPIEYLKLCNNMEKFYGNIWFYELQLFLNGNWNNNTYPITIDNYLTNNHKYNYYDNKYYKLAYNIKLNNDYHKFIFNSLKPDVPLWLKNTLLEEIINKTSEDIYNYNKEIEFIERYSSVYNLKKID